MDSDRRIKAAQTLAERGATEGERQAAAEAVVRLKSSQETRQRPSTEPDIRFTSGSKTPSQPSPYLLDILAGSRIQLERTCNRLRLCCRQGSIAVLDLEDLLPGNVPTYALRCYKCDRHLGYLHHQVSDQIREWLEAGRASVPILRDATLKR
jgi:hypothetical protein